MSRVRHVDADMVQRTREWLLPGATARAAPPQDTHLAHLDRGSRMREHLQRVVAPAGRGEGGADEGSRMGSRSSREVQNTYAVALAANVWRWPAMRTATTARQARRQAASRRLAHGGATSVIGSGGEALQIETGAGRARLAAEPRYPANVEKSIGSWRKAASRDASVRHNRRCSR